MDQGQWDKGRGPVEDSAVAEEEDKVAAVWAAVEEVEVAEAAEGGEAAEAWAGAGASGPEPAALVFAPCVGPQFLTRRAPHAFKCSVPIAGRR